MKNLLRLWLFAAFFAALAAMTSCAKDDVKWPDPGVSADDEDIDRWMFDYMKTHYLWNSAVKTLIPDYKLRYEDFLGKVLKEVAAQNDINHDDGHWEDGKRAYFYSYIERTKKSTAQLGVTRGMHQTTEGTGIQYLMGTSLYADEYIFLLGVSPESPAAKAGLQRGSIISKVDGQKINISNRESMAKKLRITSGSVRVTPVEISNSTMIEKPEITITAATFNDNPVWVKKTLTATNGDKIGYLCYDSFSYFYDPNLIAAFTDFKSQGIKHLILDLRYNSGGHVVSSAVLGTLVAGNAKKDQVYAKMTFNQDRTNAGEKGDVYKIGNASIGKGNYQPIVTAINSAVGLNTVYVLGTENTASSSELVINGLRGLGLTVRLIGFTTNGKNVGMEPITKTKDGYDYEFSPITFYSENAVGFKDYSNGFVPDVVVEETDWIPSAWGDTEDPLVYIALEWINSGTKPSVAAVSKTRTSLRSLKLPMPKKALDGMILLRGEE